MDDLQNKTLNELSEEYIMDSVQLCEIINKYRKEEKRNRAELKHCDLMKSIRAELEALENAGIEGLGNFSESSYINSQNKKQPCFALTKFGAMQMLNKESAYVRYQTQIYIEGLEYRNTILEVPYTEMAEDRIKNGFNFKEIDSYLNTDYDNDYILELNDIKSLGQFIDVGLYPYAALVKPFFDPTDIKFLDKQSGSKEIKEDYGATTVTTKEFIDLLEKNSIPYESVSGKIRIGDMFVTKGKIKVMSNRAMLYLAMTAKGSEVAQAYRKYLIDNNLVELQQINNITTEKDAKELHKLQIETKMMMDRLMKKEDRLNELEDRLNKREDEIQKDKEDLKARETELRKKEFVLSTYTVEDKGKPKFINRLKKAFKILFGGDVNTHEYVIVKHEFESDNIIEKYEESAESVKVVECEIVDSNGTAVLTNEQEEIVEVEYKPYDPPSKTREPICKEPIGKRQMITVTRELTADDIHPVVSDDELRKEFKKLVNSAANYYGKDHALIYGDAYRELRTRYKKNIYRKMSADDNVLQRLTPAELRTAIKFIKKQYPGAVQSEVKITNIKDLEVDKNNTDKK
jgi:phage regulator Rha-like protein